MSAETLLSGSVIIDSPILEVFDYIANPDHLPEWVPFYAGIEPTFGGVPDRGSRFTAQLKMFPTAIDPFSLLRPFLGDLGWEAIEVCVDDVVHGRRIAYRAQAVGWTTICDFQPSSGRTIVTTTHSLWSAGGLAMAYWMGPMQAIAGDLIRRILEGLKRRLEGRAVEPKPQIFFSYRRKHSPYVGGRIFDALASEFGSGTVFRDTDSLLAGGSWRGDIKEAIQRCRVIVAHIGENWERDLLDRKDTEDGLREELELGLQKKDIRLIPVVTSGKEGFLLDDRIKEIHGALRELGENAVNIRERFTSELQGQRLRADPDFRSDLELLMRGVWNAFRGGRATPL